jgi:hypothetical protein
MTFVCRRWCRCRRLDFRDSPKTSSSPTVLQPNIETLSPPSSQKVQVGLDADFFHAVTRRVWATRFWGLVALAFMMTERGVCKVFIEFLKTPIAHGCG